MSTKTENMNIEQFRKLEQVVKGEGKKRIVDWSKVLDKVAGTVFNATGFEATVQKLFPLKTKGVNYSEMYRVMESWTKTGNSIESRKDENGKIWYMVVKKTK